MITNLEAFCIHEETHIYTVEESRFDLKNSIIAKSLCFELFRNSKVKRLALNLENVSYMTTSGVGAILSIFHKCLELNIQFVIYNLAPDIEELLAITMVDTVVKVAENELVAINPD